MSLVRNPLDLSVEEIIKAPEYLTAEHCKRLAPLVQKGMPEEAASNEAPNLKAQLARLLRMLQKLEALSTSSTDIGEVKRVMDASRDLYNLIAKFQSAVAAEERTNAIFDSIKVTLVSMNDEALMKKFLALYKVKIEEIDARNGAL